MRVDDEQTGDHEEDSKTSEAEAADELLPDFVRCILGPFRWGAHERSVHGARAWLPFHILGHDIREIPMSIRQRPEIAVTSFGRCIDIVIGALAAIEMGENPIHSSWPHLIRNPVVTEVDGCFWLEGDEPRLDGGTIRARLPVLALHTVESWVITLHGFLRLPDREIDTPGDQEIFVEEALPPGGMP